MNPLLLQELVRQALAEDLAWGDITTEALIPPGVSLRAQARAREAGVVAGLPVFAEAFRQLSSSISVSFCVCDGTRVGPGQVLAEVTGEARAILMGERVALNLLQHLSGIATTTAQYVAALEGLPTRILDTRKTTPGLRMLEKYAVRIGGGLNHRYCLADAVLIKDNHLAILAAQGIGLSEAVRRARAAVSPMVRIEVEVENAEDAVRAAEAGADIVMLDNMSLAEMRRAVEAIGGRALVEASGNVTLETVRQVAETGVDYISVGALTRSRKGLDIGLDVVR
ncbi:MAG: carboxylating nicotinate-nucleotide diphosphorylase [Anaerolineae bacterium]|nr:carboxylating nicotinate-nucleotide diphosphorylase [Anaerolineae bacterium]MDW8098080.1 carboxylating nicotinate-nucleotide diphosphorylase [Anaerolineae bacterium]